LNFNISDFLNDTFTVLNQVKLWHYQTLRGFHHEAFGEFYSCFAGLSDSLIEGHIGQFGRFTLDDSEDEADDVVVMDNFNSDSMADWVEEFRDYFDMHREDLVADGLTGLVAIADEINNAFNKLSFKLLYEKTELKKNKV
jgi:hypothetical protein